MWRLRPPVVYLPAHHAGAVFVKHHPCWGRLLHDAVTRVIHAPLRNLLPMSLYGSPINALVPEVAFGWYLEGTYVHSCLPRKVMHIATISLSLTSSNLFYCLWSESFFLQSNFSFKLYSFKLRLFFVCSFLPLGSLICVAPSLIANPLESNKARK